MSFEKDKSRGTALPHKSEFCLKNLWTLLLLLGPQLRQLF